MKKILAFGLAVATAVTMVGCAAQTPGGNVTLPDEEPSTLLATELAAPVIPEMAQFPQEMDYYDEKTGEWDDEAWSTANEAWYADYEARTENMDATMDGLSERFLPMMSALLAGSNGENRICSPLNVYMALAMLAECTDGESRTQILDALGEDDIEALRARAKALWFENSWYDGRVTSLLANSLWLKDGVKYEQTTMDRLAADYFASSYPGEMGSEEYNEALRSWINKNTGDLLTEQAAGLVTAIAGLTGADPGTQALIQANAFWTLATCIVKATAAGWVAGLVYRALRKHQTLGCVAAAISAPLVNTGLFLLAMTTVLRPSLEAWAGGTDLVYYVFVVLTGVNFLVEFGVNAVLSVAIARIVQVVGKKG